MRSYLMLIFWVLQTNWSVAQNENDRSEIFKKKIDAVFPGAQNIDWVKKGPRYEVNFVYNNHSVSLTFNKKGYVIKSIIEKDFEELPMLVQRGLKNDYGNFKYIYVLESNHKGKITYEIEVMRGINVFILDYSKDGVLLSKNAIQKVNVFGIDW